MECAHDSTRACAPDFPVLARFRRKSQPLAGSSAPYAACAQFDALRDGEDPADEAGAAVSRVLLQARPLPSVSVLHTQRRQDALPLIRDLPCVVRRSTMHASVQSSRQVEPADRAAQALRARSLTTWLTKSSGSSSAMPPSCRSDPERVCGSLDCTSSDEACPPHASIADAVALEQATIDIYCKTKAQRAKAPRGTGPSLVKQDVEGASVFERLAVATRKLDDVRIPEFGGVQFFNLQLIACACV